MRRIALVIVTGLGLVCGPAHSEVTRVEVIEQKPFAGGRTFGQAGAYEEVRGIVHYSVDPKAASSQTIADITLSPTNADGKVEFSGPFLLLRPADPAKANGATLIEVPNRGATQMRGIFFDADAWKLPDPGSPKFLAATPFDRGFTLAWVAWQGDLAPDHMGLSVPTGTGHGPVRIMFDATDLKNNELDLNAPGNYCAASPQTPAIVKVMTSLTDHGATVDPTTYHFDHMAAGMSTRDACTLHFDGPLAENEFYEVTFEAAPARIMGLGLAAIRDFGDALKGRGPASVLTERPGDASQLLVYGYSQSARFLRDYLYRGFNADDQGKRVYDGMIIAAAGAGRGSFDHRYAMPGEAGNSVLSFLRPVDLFPFSDTPESDIDGQRREGILDHTRSQNAMPKIIETFSSSEYWARVGSLLTVTPDGKTELPLDPDERLYYFPSTVHAPRYRMDAETAKITGFPHYNFNFDMMDAMNALLVNLQAWTRDGTAPPESRYPRLGDSLGPASAIVMPKVPGLDVPSGPPPVWQLDFGPDYATQGIITQDPPVAGQHYTLLVPQVDKDGNERGGWKGVSASVPLGTFTAWTRPNPLAYARFGLLAGLNGGFLPFARTKAERLAANDPRPSIEERYGDRAGYEVAVYKAIDEAIADRMLLPEQRMASHDYAMREWDRDIDGKILPPPVY